MLGTLANIWKVPELRQQLMLTAALITAYRLVVYVPLPGISREALTTGLQTEQIAFFTCTVNGTTYLFDLVGLFTGGLSTTSPCSRWGSYLTQQRRR